MKNKNFTNKYNSNFTPMTPKKDGTKKTVAFWVLFVLIIVWTVGSILGTLSFFNVKLGSNTYTAKADEVVSNPGYTYNGNNYFVPTSITFNLGYNADLGEVELVPQYDFLKYFLSVDTVLTTSLYANGDYEYLGVTYVPSISLRVYASNKRSYLKGVMPNSYYREFNYDSQGYFTLPLLSDDNESNVVDGVRFTRNAFSFYLQENTFEGDDLIGYIETDTDISFNCNVQSINFSSTLLQPDWTHRHIKNTITYTDDTGKTCIISFHLWLNSHPNYSGISSWENRTYYIVNGEDFSNSSLFQYGYAKGKNDYLNSGFQDGVNVGYTQGYNQGKTDGIASANDYTFLGLFSALIDAPIQALSGLFNFNVMGINMFSLVSGLFTLFVVLIIVRLILGGGIGG